MVGNPQSAQVCLLLPRTGPGGGGWAERTEPGPAQSRVCEWHRVSPVERQVEGGAPGQCRLQPRPQGLLGQQQDSPAVSLQAAVRVAACRWEVAGTGGMGWGCAVGTALLGWCHCPAWLVSLSRPVPVAPGVWVGGHFHQGVGHTLGSGGGVCRIRAPKPAACLADLRGSPPPRQAASATGRCWRQTRLGVGG